MRFKYIWIYSWIFEKFQPPIWRSLDCKTTQIWWLANMNYKHSKSWLLSYCVGIVVWWFVPTIAHQSFGCCGIIFAQVVCPNIPNVGSICVVFSTLLLSPLLDAPLTFKFNNIAFTALEGPPTSCFIASTSKTFSLSIIIFKVAKSSWMLSWIPPLLICTKDAAQNPRPHHW